MRGKNNCNRGQSLTHGGYRPYAIRKCCSFCFAGDSSQRLLSTTHHLVGQCSRFWRHGKMLPDCHHEGTCSVVPAANVCQSGYAQTEHLSTCVAVMACQHGACCVLAATPSNAASLSLRLMQSLNSMSTFCQSSCAREPYFFIDTILRHTTPGASCKIRCQPSRVMNTTTRERRKRQKTKDKLCNL